MAIISVVKSLQEEWEDKWISCKCTECNLQFKENSEDLDLDQEEPQVTCPTCNHTAPLTLIGPAE